MPFTPVESSFGGILIGISVIAHMLFNGRITGMSGTINEVLKLKNVLHNHHDWIQRLVYLLGLVVGGVFLNMIPNLHDQAFNPKFNSAGTITDFYALLTNRYFIFPIAGLFVGFGTNIGSGCTSGHMICGIARLSLRSWIATPVFCGVALILARGWPHTSLLMANAFANPTPGDNVPFVTFPTWQTGVIMAAIFIAIVAIYVAILVFAIAQERKQASPEEGEEQLMSGAVKNKDFENIGIVIAIAFFNAFVFALGLGFSGMTKPQKVLGFFDIAGPNWDLSLVCVAVGAIAVDLLVFQLYIFRFRKEPMFASKFHVPANNRITPALIIGAIFFGIGWGLAGVCPGPLIVNIPNTGFTGEVWMWLGGYIIGTMTAEVIYNTIMKIKEKIMPSQV